MADVYEQRLNGHNEDYLSFIGRKFYAIVWLFNNVLPSLLFYLLIKKLNYKLIIGVLLIILTIWLHEMILGGRSRLVQNALFLFFNYILYQKYLDNEIKLKVKKYGLVFISFAVLAVAAVSVSRFNSTRSDSIDSIWLWLSLYAGEGTLNFSSLLWDITRYTDGQCTNSLLYSLIQGKFIAVEDMWIIVASSGVPGNIFYTYVGTFFSDYGMFGTILAFIILSSFVYYYVNAYKCNLVFPKLIAVSLWMKVLIVGPIFYTYTTVNDQINLLVAILVIIWFSKK